MARFRTLVFLRLCLAAGLATAQQGGDLQAQILYAYYAEDSNAAASLVQLLTTQEQANGADHALRYHLAHAQYRLGLLASLQRGRGADAAFAGCINELKAILEQDVNSVESLALQSACYANLAALRPLEAVLLRTHAEDRMSRAVELAPRNPRVELLRALDELSHAKPGSADRARAFGQLRLAAEALDQSSSTAAEAPGWGHAETYLELGRLLQARGDFLGARNWIEKSLIIAPDFKAAQRQLASLVRR